MMSALEKNLDQLIQRKSYIPYELKSGEKLYLTEAVSFLNEKLKLESFLHRMIKQQQNQAIRRQVFQEWRIHRVKKGEIHLSIKDRYGEYLYFQSFPEEGLPQMTLYLLNGVLYHPKELDRPHETGA